MNKLSNKIYKAIKKGLLEGLDLNDIDLEDLNDVKINKISSSTRSILKAWELESQRSAKNVSIKKVMDYYFGNAKLFSAGDLESDPNRMISDAADEYHWLSNNNQYSKTSKFGETINFLLKSNKLVEIFSVKKCCSDITNKIGEITKKYVMTLLFRFAFLYYMKFKSTDIDFDQLLQVVSFSLIKSNFFGNVIDHNTRVYIHLCKNINDIINDKSNFDIKQKFDTALNIFKEFLLYFDNNKAIQQFIKRFSDTNIINNDILKHKHVLYYIYNTPDNGLSIICLKESFFNHYSNNIYAILNSNVNYIQLLNLYKDQKKQNKNNISKKEKEFLKTFKLDTGINIPIKFPIKYLAISNDFNNVKNIDKNSLAIFFNTSVLNNAYGEMYSIIKKLYKKESYKYNRRVIRQLQKNFSIPEISLDVNVLKFNTDVMEYYTLFDKYLVRIIKTPYKVNEFPNEEIKNKLLNMLHNEYSYVYILLIEDFSPIIDDFDKIINS